MLEDERNDYYAFLYLKNVDSFKCKFIPYY